MLRLHAEYSNKATKKYRKVKEEIFDNLSTVSCLGDESPYMQSDEEDVVFLTEINTEVGTVRKKDKYKEFTTTNVQPAKLARLTEAAQSAPALVREYPCLNCPKKFNTTLQLMLHKQFHSVGVVPQISATPAERSDVLNTGKSATSPEHGISHKDDSRRRARKNLHGQEDEFNQSDVQNNNEAEAVRSPMEDGSLSLHTAAADNIENSNANHHSVWDADLESESTICDRSSDEDYSGDEYCSDSSIESAENGTTGNAEAAINTKSQNASAQHQGKLSKARKVEGNGATVGKKTSNEIRKHVPLSDRERRFSCSYCEKRFKENSKLRRHLLIHTGEKPYKCDECGRGFIRKDNCRAHKMTHSGKRPYKCQDCKKTYVGKDAYVAHRKMHTVEKQHCCQFCGKLFFYASLLKYHSSLHKGSKPYRCLVCKKHISTSDKWKRHVEKYHKEEYDDVAAGRIEKKAPLKKPHKCQTCEKFFISPGDLARHRRIHSGDRPHLCKFCDRTFTLSSALKRHLFTHSGTKPYLCTICKIPFAAKDDMVTHRETAHENTQSFEKIANAEINTVDREVSSTEMADNGISDTNEDVYLSERVDAIIGAQSTSRNTEADVRNKSRKNFLSEIENEQDNSMSQTQHVTLTQEGPEAITGDQCSSSRKESDVHQRSLEKKKKRRMEIEKELDTSQWQTPRKKGRQNGEMFEYTVTETQDDSQYFFHELNELSSAPQEDTYPSSLNENVVGQLAVASPKIRFKRSSIEYIIEKNAKKNPETLFVVWSENFSLDLAAAVAFNASNCILCVKKFEPSFLPDVWSISNNFYLQTAAVTIDSVSEPVHFFIFGDMNLSLGRRPFKSFKKIESRMKKFGLAEGRNIKNILRYSRNENSWYSTLLPQLKEDCIVTNKHNLL